MSKTKIKCPGCNGVRVWKKGTVPSRKGPKVRYVCIDCARTFYKPKPGKKAPEEAA